MTTKYTIKQSPTALIDSLEAKGLLKSFRITNGQIIELELHGIATAQDIADVDAALPSNTHTKSTK